MCKLAYYRTENKNAYDVCLEMLRHQENVVAGHSTSLTYKVGDDFRIRKAIGKVNSFLAKHPEIPKVYDCMGHSRYASVGEINLDNQHPIPIIVKGKTIGYGVHNGTFYNWKEYDYLRRELSNKTDSALLFTIFARLLEKIGDSEHNRRVAFSYISELTNNQNFIVMFRNGIVLFGGSVLTYKVSDVSVGVMTFGFKNECDKDYVYQIQGIGVKKFEKLNSPFKFVPKLVKPPKTKSFSYYDYDWGGFR